MSQLPFFFYDGGLACGQSVSLDADTARHIWQVLRMKAGEKINLTDGKGRVATCVIHSGGKNACTVLPEKVDAHERMAGVLHLGVSFTKNASRNEWLLEKVTELGVATIIPLKTSRMEPTHARPERWQKILQSAMLQSQQYYMPHLAPLTTMGQLLNNYTAIPNKLLAHCMTGMERQPLGEMLKPGGETILLIGPEGDFSADEVNLCMGHGFAGVSLGSRRLRTETAAMAVAACFNVLNDV